MADEPQDPPDDAPEAEDEPPEPFDEDRAKAKIAKANSEAQGLRKRLKELEAKAAKLDELEDAKKSEAERLAETQRSLEDRASKAEADTARLRIAIKKGLTETQAKRLIGSTEEELEADADDLLASFKSPDEPGPTTRPTERLRGGGDPTEDPEPDIRKVVESIPRGI